MNVLFLVRTLTYGGAERQLVALARGLHERGHDVRIMVFYPGGPLEPDARAAGIPVISVDKRGRWDIPVFFWRMARVMRAERPDIVHGYLGASNVLSLLFRPVHGGRSVWGVRASDMDREELDWIMRLDGSIERRLSRFADKVIANSHAGKANAVSQGFPAAKTTVIPNGIDTRRFRPDPAGRARVRAELGFTDDHRVIGRIGRLAPQKDYPTFLRAAASIAVSHPETRFLCVGAGPADTEAKLKDLANELGIGDCVVWTGARSDMPALYSALDLSVSSSAFGEGTPNAVAEAMACGVPGVVTDVGDSARTAGEFGAVVPPGDSFAIATAVDAMLERMEQGEIDRIAMREYICETYSLETLIERTEAELEALLRVGVTAERSAGGARA